MEFTATYYRAKASSCCKVVVTYINDELVVKLDDASPPNTMNTLYREHLTQLSISPKLGRLPREILLPDDSKLVVDSKINIDDIFSENSKGSILHFLEKNKVSWLIATTLVPILLYFLLTHAIPSAAKYVAPLLGPKYTQVIDRQVLASLDYLVLEESTLTKTQNKELNKIWQDLLQRINKLDFTFELLIRNSEKFGANAFALPGGTIVITDQLYLLLQEQPQAISAVLLHEIGHVQHHHSMQMIAETAGTTILMSYFFGDLDGIAEIFSGSALTVMQNSFSRELEREADQYAIKQLKALNISPQVFADALTIIAGTEKNSQLLEQYFSSHPLVKERIEQAIIASSLK